jgi:hypothetical protein
MTPADLDALDRHNLLVEIAGVQVAKRIEAQLGGEKNPTRAQVIRAQDRQALAQRLSARKVSRVTEWRWRKRKHLGGMSRGPRSLIETSRR